MAVCSLCLFLAVSWVSCGQCDSGRANDKSHDLREESQRIPTCSICLERQDFYFYLSLYLLSYIMCPGRKCSDSSKLSHTRQVPNSSPAGISKINRLQTHLGADATGTKKYISDGTPSQIPAFYLDRYTKCCPVPSAS